MLLYSEAFALAHLSVQNSAFCKAINKKIHFCCFNYQRNILFLSSSIDKDISFLAILIIDEHTLFDAK